MNTHKNTQDEPEYLRVSEVAKRLSVSRGVVYGWIKDGHLRAYSFAGIVRVARTDFDTFVEEAREAGSAPAANTPAHIEETEVE